MSLLIPRLPDFEEAKVPLVQRFANAPALPMGQSWLEIPQPHLTLGRVRLAWGQMRPIFEDSLWVWAVLADETPYNAATAPNQATWELGDCFEMFFQPGGERFYYEWHVTPHNESLCLKYKAPPSKTNDWKKNVTAEKPFWSQTRVAKDDKSWQCLAAIPLTLLGDYFHGSFSRYDYQPDQDDPVLSSTSNHTVANFHRRQEWEAFEIQI